MKKLQIVRRITTIFASIVLVAGVIFGLPALVAADEDAEAPVLTAFSLSPTTIDTSSGDAVLTLSLTLTDNQSGICIEGDTCSGGTTQLVLRSEDNNNQALYFTNLNRTDGNDQSGTYEATATLPEGVKNGNWTVDTLWLIDKIGNTKTMTAQDITEALPSASGVTINNTASSYDDDAPALTALSLSPTSFSTESGSQELTLTVTLQDDMAGVCITSDCGSFYNSSPTQMELKSKKVPDQKLIFSEFTRDDGDEFDGTYTATATLPQNVASGEWVIDTFASVDRLGNSRAYETGELTGMPGVSGTTIVNSATTDDITAPNVTTFSITPGEINTGSEEQTLHLEMTVTDNLSGACISGDCGSFFTGSPVQVRIIPLIGTQRWDFVDLSLQSGDATNGVYTADVTLPVGSKQGIWQVDEVYLTDKLGNQRSMSASELGDLPGVVGQTIVNTASADSVLIERDWTITGSSGSVTFPEGTEITRDNNGNFAFYQMVNQPYDVDTLPDNNRVDADSVVSTLRVGVPSMNLNFSQPVVVSLNVSPTLNDKTLAIQSIKEDGVNWNNETTCTVVSGVCTFTVNHATYFLASLSSASGNGSIPVDGIGAPNTGLPPQNMIPFALALVSGLAIFLSLSYRKLVLMSGGFGKK